VYDNLDAVTVKGGDGQEPTVTLPAPMAIDKTRTKVLIPGDGATLKETDTVEVNYVGVNGRTGEVFDDSWSRGSTADFPLDQVVPGFTKGLTGQKVGSRVLIGMPGTDGYDASGGNAQAGINVGDSLFFVVDIESVQLTGPKGAPVAPKAGLPTVTDKDGVPQIKIPDTAAPSELTVQPLIKGTGPAVKATDVVTVNFRGWNWETKALSVESYTSRPVTGLLSQTLPSWKGLVGQTVGSRVLLVASGKVDNPNNSATPPVPNDEHAIYVIDILNAKTAN